MRTEKRSSPQISGDMVSLYNTVSPQNGDTRGGPPPPSDAIGWVHVASRFPIDVENPREPVVATSRVSNKCRRGNSLAWSKQTSH